jgi:hypothetical protein
MHAEIGVRLELEVPWWLKLPFFSNKHHHPSLFGFAIVPEQFHPTVYTPSLLRRLRASLANSSTYSSWLTCPLASLVPGGVWHWERVCASLSLTLESMANCLTP